MKTNEDRCRGYRFCMEACPYKKIYFNRERAVSQKCIFCFPGLEQGGDKSELLDVLIAYKWSDLFGGFDKGPANIEWTDTK